MAHQSGNEQSIVFVEEESDLAVFLSAVENSGEAVKTHLQASDRVIARVTDGIYREPASALRELISNAWDADASSVTILTDAPRYERIYVRDDGNGMSYQTLSHLIKNIGGSAKRSGKGQDLGVTSATDNEKSPGGRLLIGKVGIGLFSVSQLARRFRIITKVKGEAYRLIAEVTLRAYSEMDDEYEQAEKESSDNYISGVVEIVRQEAQDLDSHGTDLILEELKPRVRDLLSDRDRWTQVILKEQAERSGDKEVASNIRVIRPVYHSGWIEPKARASQSSVLSVQPNYPWSKDSEPECRMSLLMDAIERESSKTERPDIESSLDAYLGMIWTLGLSAPVEYVDGHPFDMEANDQLELYWISNDQKGQAVELPMEAGETVREAVRRCAPGNPQLREGDSVSGERFRVFIDSVELKRPIRYRFIPAGEKSLNRTLLFVGKYHPDLKKISEDRRGGGLEMEGYIFWNGRIIPKENNGVLIRIRGSSGAKFDQTFFKYQVSELTRLRQLTSELYIQKGLDAALNIDRESFNFSHPHVQLVALWLQRGIRQLTNKHKDITARERKQRSVDASTAAGSVLNNFVDNLWTLRQSDEPLPEVAIDSSELVEEARKRGGIAFRENSLYKIKSLQKKTLEERQLKVKALAQILLAFDVLQGRPFEEQESLINAILKVFYGVEE